MNMIIAGDGHNNIRSTDTLVESQLIAEYVSRSGVKCQDGLAHLILTNPPFGTSEGESIPPAVLSQYPVRSTKGQSLFIQKMIGSVHPESLIVTVIDNGVLNTASYSALRRHIMETCRIEFVVSLPDETFKPNKINVRASVLVLRRRPDDDVDLADKYDIGVIDIESLGYDGAGNLLRGFRYEQLMQEISAIEQSSLPEDSFQHGYMWRAFKVNSAMIASDGTHRMDSRYWQPQIRAEINALRQVASSVTVEECNTIPTKRGKSPPAAEYVSESEGFALVVKAGSNITKTGCLVPAGDFIEEPVYREYEKKGLILLDGDIVLSSTGEGTLGKCCVYRNTDENGESLPAVPEGHVTVIRVDQNVIHPEFLCDYLRVGFGYEQMMRLFTGTTGLIELTPDDVDQIVVPKFPSLNKQKQLSEALRKGEAENAATLEGAANKLKDAKVAFRERTRGIK